MIDDILGKKIAEWSKDFDPEKIVRIDNKVVHKVNEENNFVARIEQIQKGDSDIFLSQFAINGKHPYFFEHAYDHVPGLMIIESGRQVGTAIAHLFYDVTFDIVFILNEMNIRFFRYVSQLKPLFIRSMVRNKLIRKNKLIQMEHDGYFIQGGQEVAYMGGTWLMYEKKIIERFRRSAKDINLSVE